jgi:hypothetical protein
LETEDWVFQIQGTLNAEDAADTVVGDVGRMVADPLMFFTRELKGLF